MLLANDDESHPKEASRADKKTCSRSIALSQLMHPASSSHSFVEHDYAA